MSFDLMLYCLVALLFCVLLSRALLWYRINHWRKDFESQGWLDLNTGRRIYPNTQSQKKIQVVGYTPGGVSWTERERKGKLKIYEDGEWRDDQ